MKNNRKILWFTLVELIVVITIVWILSTVWFVSYSGYLMWARDSSRISQVVKLSDSLQVYASTKSLPLPDNYVEITASWTTIAYQWEVGVDVLETIDFTNGWKDPKDDSYFTYYVSKNRKNLQIMAFMEEQESISFNNISSLYANDNSDRYPKVYGKKMWILTQETTHIPIQDIWGLSSIDIVSTPDTYVAHIADDEKITGTWASLRWSIPNASCKRIRQTWWSEGDWDYTINTNGMETTYFCDMASRDPFFDELRKQWDFENGAGITTENNSRPTVDIMKMRSPIDSWYVLHFTGDRPEYQIWFTSIENCKAGDEIWLRAWVSWIESGIFSVFHSRIYHTDLTEDIFTINQNPVTLLKERVIDRDWYLISTTWIVQKDVADFQWYAWYNAEWSSADFYMAWLRMYCIKK